MVLIVIVTGSSAFPRSVVPVTSNVFKAGHRIRVEVSSSNFPRFNRNLNTGEPVPDATRTVVANQTVFHDPEHPSYIILPVIPR